jgi:hypothetical protein
VGPKHCQRRDNELTAVPASLGFAVESELACFWSFDPGIQIDTDHAAAVVARDLDRIAGHTDDRAG